MNRITKKDDDFKQLVEQIKTEREELRNLVETPDSANKKKRHLIHTPGFIIGYAITSMIFVTGIVLHLKGYF